LERKPLIKKVLREALGVPDKIYETSQQVYKKISSWVETLDESDFESGEGANTSFRVNMNIADYHFTTLKVKLGIESHKKIKEPEIMSMILRTESKKTEDLKLEPIKRKTVDLIIVMVVPKDFNFEELSDFFVYNEEDIVESISHELKHVYDHFKRLYDSPQERAEYQSTIQLGFGLEPLDRFVHDIYYSSGNENLVRSTEVASAIKNNQISQKEFLDFLKNNDTYRNLKRISEFKLEKFKQDILSDQKKLDKILKKMKMKPEKMSDEQKLQAIFNLLYVTISNARINNFQEILTHSFFEQLLGFEGEKLKMFTKFVNKNQRFQNSEDFVKYYEKYFNYIGNQMLRKISKLYAITNK